MTLIWSSISNWYSRIEFIKSTSHKQLELELSPLEQFFLNQLSITSDPLTVTVAAYAIGLLQEARDELKNRRAQNAWALFYRAELEQYKLFGDREINARAGKILFQSASKLEDGAKQNVRRLIGVDSQNGDWKLKNPLERDSVVEARRIVQEYYTDKYTCLGLTFPQLFVLAAIAIFITSILIFTLPGITEPIASTNAVFWLNIGLFGAVGGSISGLLGLQQAFSSTNDIPEKVLNKWVTIAKPIIGFAAAVLIAIFIIGGLVQVADIAVSNYLIYAMAFVSGFSERLIIGAVESRLP